MKILNQRQKCMENTIRNGKHIESDMITIDQI